MTFEIKQNNEFITLNSFDEQYCAFTGEKLLSDTYRRWFSLLECVFNTWGDNTNYLVNPMGLINLFEVSCFEELEDVYKHTKILYNGFDTKNFVNKKGIHQTIKILKFDKI